MRDLGEGDVLRAAGREVLITLYRKPTGYLERATWAHKDTTGYTAHDGRDYCERNVCGDKCHIATIALERGGRSYTADVRVLEPVFLLDCECMAGSFDTGLWPAFGRPLADPRPAFGWPLGGLWPALWPALGSLWPAI